MKKIISFLIVIAIMFLMCGCNGSEKEKTDNTSSKTDENVVTLTMDNYEDYIYFFYELVEDDYTQKLNGKLMHYNKAEFLQSIQVTCDYKTLKDVKVTVLLNYNVDRGEKGVSHYSKTSTVGITPMEGCATANHTDTAAVEVVGDVSQSVPPKFTVEDASIVNISGEIIF